jgi:hypothetical protein
MAERVGFGIKAMIKNRELLELYARWIRYKLSI